jgi:hypothetical protein
MIVVTGTPRSGTSWMMQDLIELGFNVVGTKFSKRNKEILNPKGYWEIAQDYTLGLNQYDKDTDPHKGSAIKIFGYQLLYIKPELIEKSIICERSKNFAVKSYVKFLHVDVKNSNIAPSRANAELLYNIHKESTDGYFKINKDIPTIRVNMLYKKENIESEIRRIANFVNVKDETKIQNAINNAGV